MFDKWLMAGSWVMFGFGIKYEIIPFIVFGPIIYFAYPIFWDPFLNFLALFQTEANYKSELYNKETLFQNLRYPIVYNPRYSVTAFGIERLHPFDAQKYGRIYKFLKEKNIITSKKDIHVPSLVSRKLLLSSHSKLNLFLLNYSIYISKIVELPVCFLPSPILRWRLLEPMGYATQGTVDGSILALKRGWAINLSGGYHHACCQRGGGFCVYADIGLCIKHLKKYYSDKTSKYMIIDLDAHQGNGHERDFFGQNDVFIVDMYNPDIYPGDDYARKGIGLEIHVRSNDSSDAYIQIMKNKIPIAIDSFKPDFILYNAGTDCLEGDPLGRLNVTKEGIVLRDELIFNWAVERKIPILMVLSGGYQRSNAPVIADSVKNILTKFDHSINKV